MSEPAFTIDEQIVVCISRQVEDGEFLAQGLATPLAAAGLILAKRTHAPHAVFASAIGQGVVFDWAPLSVAAIEDLWIGKAAMQLGFTAIAADILPTLNPKEFFRPAQVDAGGNFNNIAIGKTYERPRLRLPGTGGIPDVTVTSQRIYLYVPRHSRAIFVPQLDFLSGMGHHPARQRGHGTRWLVTDLGEFDWHNGQMRLLTYHHGVDIKRIQRKTGFEILIADDVHETEPPTAEELRILREEADPLGVRRLEVLSGAARRAVLREILANEKSQFEP